MVQGTGSVAGVAVSSSSYDLTLALPVFGCSVQPSEGAAEQYQQMLAYQRWLQSGKVAKDQVLFDFTAAELRLETASGEVVLEIESAEGGVTLRGTAENAASLMAEGPSTIVGNLSDLTLEVTRDQDTFSCIEPVDVSLSMSEAH